MENLMRKSCLALLISSLCISQAPVRADDATLLADAKTNFESSRRASAAAPAQPADANIPKPQPAATPEAARSAEDEIIRRQADQQKGRLLIDEGQKLYYDAKF